MNLYFIPTSYRQLRKINNVYKNIKYNFKITQLTRKKNEKKEKKYI